MIASGFRLTHGWISKVWKLSRWLAQRAWFRVKLWQSKHSVSHVASCFFFLGQNYLFFYVILFISILFLYYFYLIFIILVFCQGSGGFRVGSGWFRVSSGWFRQVPVGSGRFRVGSVFYIHPKVSGRKTIQSQHCESQFVPVWTDFFFLVPFKESRFPLFGISIQAGKRSSRSITERSCATGIDFFYKAQASNFQRRPWSAAANQLGMNAPESFSNLACFKHHSLLRKERPWKPTRDETRWPFSSKQQQAGWSTSSQARERRKISPPSSATEFTHSVFHRCEFSDWNTFLSSQVFEQFVGIYEPNAPSFRVFDPRGVTRVNSQDSLSNFVQSQWK